MFPVFKAISQRKSLLLCAGISKIDNEAAGYKLDPSKNPKAIDLVNPKKENEVYLGIYWLEGDELALCHNLESGSDAVRPTKFSVTGNAGRTVLMALKRERTNQPEDKPNTQAAPAPQTAQASSPQEPANVATTTTVYPGIDLPPANMNVMVKVTAAGKAPPGSVTLSVDGTPVGTQTLSNGQAVFNIANPGAGNHTLLAVYSGAPGYLSSQGTASTKVGIPNILEQQVAVKKAAVTIAEHQVKIAKAKLDAGKAGLKAANASFLAAALETDRLRKLFDDGAIPAQVLRQAEVKLTSLQAAVTESSTKVIIAEQEVGIEQARVELARAELAEVQARLQQGRPGQPPQPKNEAAMELLKTEVKAAQQALRELNDIIQKGKFDNGVISAEIYTWSVRLLRAQGELSATKDERIAAFVDHEKRMKEVKKIIDIYAETGLPLVPAIRPAGIWYVTEAERWLLQERAK